VGKCFSGRQIHQFPTGLGSECKEWEVEGILSHTGAGKDSEFELKWKFDDIAWELWYVVKDLSVLKEYLELAGVKNMKQLATTAGRRSRIEVNAICMDTLGML